MPTTRPDQQGFTLLEILVVLLLVTAGFSLLASGVSQGLKNAQERQVKRDLSMTLRQARNLAIATGQRVLLRLDVLHNSYQLPGQPARQLPSGITLRLITVAGSNDHEGVIIFYPNGGASGGHLYLTRGTQQTRIDIQWLTGQITWRDIQQL